MRQLDAELHEHVTAALELAKAGELVRTIAPTQSELWREWSVSRLEALHELAFLRVFIAWESFLHESLCHYMCGHDSARFGPAVPVSGHQPNVKAAEAALLGKRDYILWHDPALAIARCQRHLTSCRHEIVLRAMTARLAWYSSIRHRIAHGQSDAKKKFDAATTALAGRRYPASRPGRFLRDWTMMGTTRVRWLEAIVMEIAGLASQIV